MLVRKYNLTFEGPKIEAFPANYPWWEQIRASLKKEVLPEFVFSDTVVMQLTIQGPDEYFITKEFQHRKSQTFNKIKERCPKARITGEVIESTNTRAAAKPVRDYSPNQSPDFQAWITSFEPQRETA